MTLDANKRNLVTIKALELCLLYHCLTAETCKSNLRLDPTGKVLVYHDIVTDSNSVVVEHSEGNEILSFSVSGDGRR